MSVGRPGIFQGLKGRLGNCFENTVSYVLRLLTGNNEYIVGYMNLEFWGEIMD